MAVHATRAPGLPQEVSPSQINHPCFGRGGHSGWGGGTSEGFLGWQVPGVSSLRDESFQVLCLYMCRLLIDAEHLNYRSRNGIFLFFYF